jgi:hypothetical protein
MIDKSLHFFLVATFGIGAILILLVSWLTPMPMTERIMMSFFATIGVTWAWMVR